MLAGAAEHARQPLPAIPGNDVAGVATHSGEGITGCREGDAVFGMAAGGGVPGSLAEYMAADARLLARKPANLTMRKAAALPLVVITAWEGLIDRAAVPAGQRVRCRAARAGSAGWRCKSPAPAAPSRPPRARPPETAIEARVGKPNLPPDRGGACRPFEVFDTAGGASLAAAFLIARRFGHVVSALWVRSWPRARELAEAGKRVPQSTRAASRSARSTTLIACSRRARRGASWWWMSQRRDPDAAKRQISSNSSPLPFDATLERLMQAIEGRD